MPTTASIAVNANTTLATLGKTSFGTNYAVWDVYALDPTTSQMLAKMPFGAMRGPAGSTGDFYHPFGTSYLSGGTPDPTKALPPFDPAGVAAYAAKWTYPSEVGGANPANNVDTLQQQVLGPNNMESFWIVNYGSNTDFSAGGDPVEAAKLVTYVNSTKSYGWKYFCIGNETYGNGTFGGHWEVDAHATPHTPQQYATNWLTIRNAMKAATGGTNIKVGCVLTCPSNWPDQQQASYNGQNLTWNQIVLSLIGQYVDFVEIHWYSQGPGQENDQNLLASTYTHGASPNGALTIAEMMTAMRALFATYCTSNPIGTNIPVYVTESNSVSYAPGPQTLTIQNGLFQADSSCEWLANGAAGWFHWGDRNGPNLKDQNNSYFASGKYGDYGLLSKDKTTENGVTMPNDNTPYPTYYCLALLSLLRSSVTAADRLVAVTPDSSNPKLRAHACLRADGLLALKVTNTDPQNSITGTFTLTGFSASSLVTGSTYGLGGAGQGYGQGAGVSPSTGAGITAVQSSAVIVNSPTSITYAFGPYTEAVLLLSPTSGAVSTGGGSTASVTVSGTSATLAGGATSVAPGGVITLGATLQATGPVTNAEVQWLLADPTGATVTSLPQKTGVALAANTPLTVSLAYTVPSSAPQGLYTAKAQFIPSGSSTPVASDSGASTYTVAQQNTKPAPVVSSTTLQVGSTTLILQNTPDTTTTDGHVHQGAVLVTASDPKHPLNGTKIPLVLTINPATLDVTPIATADQMTQLLGLLSGAGSLQAVRQVQWLVSDNAIGDAQHPLAARASIDTVTDTGVITTSGLEYIALQITVASQTATAGSPRVEFWLERRLKSGVWDATPLYHVNQISGTTPNQTVYQIITPYFSGTNVTFGAFTDATRLRWAVTSDAGGSATATSLFSIQMWGQ